MSGSVNLVFIIGNLGADPEIRQTQDGKSICNLRVATTESWRDKQSGEKREKTEWHTITVFNDQLASLAQRFLKKGSKVNVIGQLQTRKWQDNSGNDRYSTEIVVQGFKGELNFLDKPTGDNAQPAPQARQAPKPQSKFPGRDSHAKSFDADLDDEVPW